MKQISIQEIEKVIISRVENGSPFTLAEVLADLHASESDQALRERVDHALLADEALFSEGETFQSRARFFEGKTFAVTPDEREIEMGLLFPGHRFMPFCAPEVFPSEVILIDQAEKEEFTTREFADSLQDVFPYHLLMGSEQISDFFIAEHPDNLNLSAAARAKSKVKLHLFDLGKFFKRHQFQLGDALLCKVKDYENGVFELKYLAGDKRENKAITRWCDHFADALELVIDRFETYLDIPEQLSWAFYLGGAKLFGSKSASLDEFIKITTRIEIAFESEHTILIKKVKADEETETSAEVALPDGLTISQGSIDSIAGILKESGSTLTTEELDGFILDDCYLRETEFETFFNRAFDRENLHFADDAQQAVFQNYLEERFEELSASYNRFDDEHKAPLRSQILEVTEARLAFLQELKNAAVNESDIPAEPLKRMAEASLYLNQLLGLLNNPAHSIAPEDFDSVAQSVDRMENIQEDAINELQQLLKI